MTASTTKKAARIVVAAVVTMSASGCLSKTADSHESVDAQATQMPGADAAAGAEAASQPRRLEHGVPVGWPLTQAGAEGAASAFVRATSLIARSGPLTRRDVVLTMATTASGPELVSSVNDELKGLTVGSEGRSVSPSELLWAEFPLTVTSVMTSDTTVQVRVWSVLIVGIEGGSVARQVWRTSTLSLEIERGDWKVAEWIDAVGPSPVAVDDADLATVADLSEVTSWAVVGAVA